MQRALPGKGASGEVLTEEEFEQEQAAKARARALLDLLGLGHRSSAAPQQRQARLRLYLGSMEAVLVGAHLIGRLLRATSPPAPASRPRKKKRRSHKKR